MGLRGVANASRNYNYSLTAFNNALAKELSILEGKSSLSESEKTKIRYIQTLITTVEPQINALISLKRRFENLLKIKN